MKYRLSIPGLPEIAIDRFAIGATLCLGLTFVSAMVIGKWRSVGNQTETNLAAAGGQESQVLFAGGADGSTNWLSDGAAAEATESVSALEAVDDARHDSNLQLNSNAKQSFNVQQIGWTERERATPVPAKQFANPFSGRFRPQLDPNPEPQSSKPSNSSTTIANPFASVDEQKVDGQVVAGQIENNPPSNAKPVVSDEQIPRLIGPDSRSITELEPAASNEALNEAEVAEHLGQSASQFAGVVKPNPESDQYLDVLPSRESNVATDSVSIPQNPTSDVPFVRLANRPQPSGSNVNPKQVPALLASSRSLANLAPANSAPVKSTLATSAPAAATARQDSQPGDLAGTLGSTAYLLAEQPKAEDQYHDRPPLMSGHAFEVPYSEFDFAPDPTTTDFYDGYAQQDVYQGKSLYANQRPLVELGKPWYQMGQIAPGKLWFGRHNPASPQFLVYGDFRTAMASNVNAGNQQSISAMRLNLDFDLRLTSTERFHWFMGPLDRGANFTRWVHDGGETHFISEFDPDIDFGYFEGDFGAIWGGLSNKTLPFDLPFAMGVMPLLFQNGVWLEDDFLGWAVTIPARNSPTFDISNMDITFFAGYDKITSGAFAGDDHDAKLYGMASFIEAAGGYIELDYAFLEDRSQLDRSYHNSSVSYTRRYGRFVSNSVRMINNAGQSPNGIDQTADGTVLLFENSLISGSPLSFVPYYNGFVGFDRPQSAARSAASGGVLRNTGILFETDGLTGYPTLDATANNTYGGAIGLNIIAKDFSQQLILEAAMVQPFEGQTSSVNGSQYGLGMRYQLPLSNSVILRCDSMYGMNENDADVQGYRVELRKKW